MNMEKIAPGVYCLAFSVSNVYLVGEPGGGSWAIVDTGVPGHFDAIKSAAARVYGDDAKPAAIILTHSHFDHYGSALDLATYYDVPVHAHRLERPYLTGQTLHPPADPTVGGFFAFVSRFLPDSGTDLEGLYQELPADGSVPGLPDWRYIETPGHTVGHVSLFRDSDRTLLAGDAVITVDADRFKDMATRRQKISRPPSPVTYDWAAVRASVNTLAALRPAIIATGHGIPMSGPPVAETLRTFAESFSQPLHGRYIPEPARYDDEGNVEYLPPPAPDRLPLVAAGVAVAALAVAGAYYVGQKRQKKKGGV